MSVEIYFTIAWFVVACVILFVRYFKRAKKILVLINEQKRLIFDLQAQEQEKLVYKLRSTSYSDVLQEAAERAQKLREAQTKLLLLEASLTDWRNIK